MKEPTEAQIQEFWEKLGVYLTRLDTPNVKTYPPIDLNNLFKYAVPKLDGLRLDGDGEIGYYAIVGASYIHRNTGTKCHSTATAKDKDPALALFQAIYKVI